MGVGVDHQVGRVLLFQPLKTLDAAAGINEGGHLVVDEDRMGEGELSPLFSLDQEDGRSDFG